MSAPQQPAVEVTRCPMCDGVEQRTLHSFPPYGVVRCAVCRLCYLSPRLPETAMLETYRTGEYYEGGEMGYQSYAEQEAALRATYRRVVRELVKSGLAGGDLLEVGCGYGFLLEEARGVFASCTGTELSRRAAEAARLRGLNVHQGGLQDLPEGAAWDCIVSAHVVEHVYDPRAFVAQLTERLRPGGALVLGTPDMGSAWRRAMGRRWPSFKIPEHVLYFDRSTLSRLLLEAGLTDVRPFFFRHAFPLSLVANKLGLGAVARRAGPFAALPIWLPATTLALSARRPGESQTGALAGPARGR